MRYLHQSPLGSHGRLTSTNCLVDDTWTCKVADFGLGYFRKMQMFHSSVSNSHRNSSERICTVCLALYRWLLSSFSDCNFLDCTLNNVAPSFRVQWCKKWKKVLNQHIGCIGIQISPICQLWVGKLIIVFGKITYVLHFPENITFFYMSFKGSMYRKVQGMCRNSKQFWMLC